MRMSIRKRSIQERANIRSFIRDLDSQAWLPRKSEDELIDVSVGIWIHNLGIRALEVKVSVGICIKGYVMRELA